MRPKIIDSYVEITESVAQKMLLKGFTIHARLYARLEARAFASLIQQDEFVEYANLERYEESRTGRELSPLRYFTLLEDRAIARIREQHGIETYSLRPPLYWRCYDWVSDEAVWSAAADEVIACLGHLPADGHGGWATFTDLPALLGVVQQRQRDGHAPKILRRWERDHVQSSLSQSARQRKWNPCFALACPLRSVKMLRRLGFAPADWQNLKPEQAVRPVYSWTFAKALLAELKLPEELFVMRLHRGNSTAIEPERMIA